MNIFLPLWPLGFYFSYMNTRKVLKLMIYIFPIVPLFFSNLFLLAESSRRSVS